MTSANATSGILSKVMGLLNQADHPGTDPVEAATFRAKAESLMRKYRLEEENLIAVDPTSVLPEWADIDVCLDLSPFRQSYISLAYYAALHAGVRYLFDQERNAAGPRTVMRVCGYAGDLRMLEWVYASMRAVFQERLEPSVDRNLSDAENVWRLRSAGITRQQVSKLLWDIETHVSLSRVGSIYKAECARRGEVAALDGRGISAAQYRTAYASNFVWEMHDRLRRARDASDGSGGALVFHGRTERVDEAFYERYDWMRPRPDSAVAVPEEEKTPAQIKAEEKAIAKRERALQRKLDRGPTQKERAEDRARYSAAAMAGYAAGRGAAQQVELDRVRGTARIDPGSGRTPLEG